MKIIALMVVKNEDDVVGYAIDDALKWADHIIIMNNNSTDNTESVILEKVASSSKVKYWGRYDGVFRDGLRALLYLDNKELFSPGDWIVRLDADEFFIDNPFDFLSAAPDKVNFVKSASFQYYYTEKDHERELSDLNYLDTPPHLRLKYYSCNWSEYRCVKFTEDFSWPLGEKMGTAECWPVFREKYVFSQRIHLKHFKYRSLGQIQKRVAVRMEVFAKTKQFPHEGNNLNEDRIYSSKTMNYDDGVRDLIFNYDKLPPLISVKEKEEGKAFII